MRLVYLSGVGPVSEKRLVTYFAIYYNQDIAIHWMGIVEVVCGLIGFLLAFLCHVGRPKGNQSKQRISLFNPRSAAECRLLIYGF